MELRLVRGRLLHVAHPHGHRPVTTVELAKPPDIRQRNGVPVLIELVHAHCGDQFRRETNELRGLLVFGGTGLTAGVLFECGRGLGSTTRSGHCFKRGKHGRHGLGIENLFRVNVCLKDLGAIRVLNLADNVRSGSLSTRSDRRIGVRKVNVVRSRKTQDVEQRVIQAARVLGDSQVDSNLLRGCGANFLVESNENSVDRVLRCIHQVLTAPRHTRIVADRT